MLRSSPPAEDAPRIQVQTGHPGLISGLSIDHYGRLAAFWGSDGLTVWSTPQWAMLNMLPALSSVQNAYFAWDGSVLVIRSHDRLRLYEIARHQVVSEIELIPWPHVTESGTLVETGEDRVTALAASTQGTSIATSHVIDGTPRAVLWNPSTGQRIEYTAPGPIDQIRWNRNGTHVVLSVFSTLHVLSLDGEDPPRRISVENGSPPPIFVERETIGLSDDAKTAFTLVNVANDPNQKELRAFAVDTGEVRWRVTISNFNSEPLPAPSFYGDTFIGLYDETGWPGLQLNDGTLVLLDPDTGELTSRFVPDSSIPRTVTQALSGDARLALTPVPQFHTSNYVAYVAAWDTSNGYPIGGYFARASAGRVLALDRARKRILISDLKMGDVEVDLVQATSTPYTPSAHQGNRVPSLIDMRSSAGGRPLIRRFPESDKLNMVSVSDPQAETRLAPSGSSSTFDQRYRLLFHNERCWVYDVIEEQSALEFARSEAAADILFACILERRGEIIIIDAEGGMERRSLADGRTLSTDDGAFWLSDTWQDTASVKDVLESPMGNTSLVVLEKFISTLPDEGSLVPLRIGRFESAALSPDGRRMAIQDINGVLVFEGETDVIEEFTSLDRVSETRVENCSNPIFIDNDRLLGTHRRGGLGLWDAASGELLVEMFFSDRGECVFLEPGGRYLAQRGALDIVTLTDGPNSTSFDWSDLDRHRPAEVLRKLGWAPADRIRQYEQVTERRRQRAYGPQGSPPDGQAPSLSLLDPVPFVSSEDDVAVSVRVAAGDSGVKSVHAYVNGNPVFGATGKGVEIEDQSVGVVVLPLLPGLNRVTMHAVDVEERHSAPVTVFIHSQAESCQSKTYFLGIGVSDYGDEGRNLRFAAKDVLDASRAFERLSDGRFAELLLLDDGATVEAVRTARKFLSPAELCDRVIVYMAGHGLIDENGRYVFATTDCDFDNPGATGLSFPELESLLYEVSANQKLVFIDTCHAGDLEFRQLDEARVPAGGRGLTVRGLELTDQPIHAPMSELENSFADLRNSGGATIVAAAGGAEFAFEGRGVSNGLFTYCVLDATRTGEPDVNHDGDITARELVEFLSNQVSVLSDGHQRPVMKRAVLRYDPPVVSAVGAEELAEITTGPIDKAVISPEGNRLAMLSHDHLTVVDLTTNDILLDEPQSGLAIDNTGPWHFEWSPDGKYIIHAHLAGGWKRTIIPGGETEQIPHSDSWSAMHAHVAPMIDRLAVEVNTEDQRGDTIEVIELSTLEPVFSVSHEQWFSSFRLDSEGGLVCETPHELQFFDSEGQSTKTVDLPSRDLRLPFQLRDISFSDHAEYLILSSAGTHTLHETEDLSVIRSFENDGIGVRCMTSDGLIEYWANQWTPIQRPDGAVVFPTTRNQKAYTLPGGLTLAGRGVDDGEVIPRQWRWWVLNSDGHPIEWFLTPSTRVFVGVDSDGRLIWCDSRGVYGQALRAAIEGEEAPGEK